MKENFWSNLLGMVSIMMGNSKFRFYFIEDAKNFKNKEIEKKNLTFCWIYTTYPERFLKLICQVSSGLQNIIEEL